MLAKQICSNFLEFNTRTGLDHNADLIYISIENGSKTIIDFVILRIWNKRKIVSFFLFFRYNREEQNKDTIIQKGEGMGKLCSHRYRLELI